MKSVTYINTAGQVTAIIPTQVAKDTTTRIAVAQVLLQENRCEQVAFLDSSVVPATLIMMGGELCINATMAAAFELIEDGLDEKILQLDLPGSMITVSYTANQDGFVTVKFPRSSILLSINGQVVQLLGITYQLINGLPKNKELSKLQLRLVEQLAQNTPAAGLIFYAKNQIVPVVYVKETRSIIWEQACGSGSLAFSLVTGTEQVIQPSKEVITINAANDTLSISATARKVRS